MKRYTVSALLLGAAWIPLSTAALAQEGPAATVTDPIGDLQDDATEATGSAIIVTAQRREQSIQDVPIAVSAFDENTLKDRRIDSASDLNLAVPNLHFSNALYGTNNFQIRGIGFSLVTTAGEQGVGVHVNDAPVDRSRIADTDFYDIERVEVLRGPQGTLYGRNATGGVINLITAKPEFGDISGSVTGEYGSDNLFRGKGHINFSTSDRFGVRVAAFGLSRDGNRFNAGTGNDINSRAIYSVRTTVAAEPADWFRIYGIWEYFDEDDSRTSGAKVLCATDPGPASVGGVPVNDVRARAFLSQGCQPVSIYDPAAQTGVPNGATSLSGVLANLLGFGIGDLNAGVTQPADPYSVNYARDPRLNTINHNFQIGIDVDLSDTLTLSSLTNRNFDRSLQQGALPQGSVPFRNTFATPGGFIDDPQVGRSQFLTILQRNELMQKQFSQELRLQSDFGSLFDFSVGAIYFETERQNDLYFLSNAQTAYVRAAVPSAYVDPNPIPDRTGHNYYLSPNDYRLKSKAAFGELYIRPSDTLSVTLGARYTDDKKQQPFRILPLFRPGRGFADEYLQVANFREWTGRATVDWQPTPENLIFASYSRGYKGGGFNPGDINLETSNTFDPEFVDAFELGTKNTFFDGAVTFNASAFYYKYDNYQYSVSTGLSTETRNVNTRLYGLDVETGWEPVDRFVINGALGLLHTEVLDGPNNLSVDPFNLTGGDPSLTALKTTSLACVGPTSGVATLVSLINAGAIPASALVGACPTEAAPNGAFAGLGLPTFFGVPTDITGNRLPQSPEVTASIGAQYTFLLGGEWALTPRADFHYEGGIEGDIYNNPNNTADSWTNVNATISLTNEESGLQIQGFVRNLFDSSAVTNVSVNGVSLGLSRTVYYLEPRSYGISIQKRF